MTETVSFASRIHERYPEGLTGVFAIGGTRTTYILERNRGNENPGRIQEFSEYSDFILDRYLDFITTFLDLGGHNMIITALSYHRFYDHGEEYTHLIAEQTLHLINEKSLTYYRSKAIDPYFVGIDTLLQLNKDHPAHKLGAELDTFQKSWPYQEGRRKLIWEIAVIPLFSFWRAHHVMGSEAQAQLEAEIKTATNMDTTNRVLYKYYARAAYGTDIPTPHFYLGSNRNGDLKLRSLFPIALLCGGPFRMFYTPYPTLFTTRETLQIILEDLAFGKELRSTRTSRTDYSEQYSSELAEAEYQWVLNMSADPLSTLGLRRKLSADADE